jgi:hypothetical protein
MRPYRNLSGHSGVTAYEIGRDSITLCFVDGATYRYTVRSAGAAHIAAMKTLAAAGRGLSTFVSQHVRDRYERRLDPR